VELPGAGVWKLDRGHAEVGFVGRHLMLTRVRGRFRDVDATVELGEDPTAARLEATVGVASVDTGDETRDDHLRSADLFDVERHPTASFRSTRVELQDTRGTVPGDLTIKGVTRPLALHVAFLGAVVDPWGNQRAAFEAGASIDRDDWGLTWNVALDSGGLLVSRRIDLDIHVEFVREA
jgi:polyisoprenoid-binding protein YceI